MNEGRVNPVGGCLRVDYCLRSLRGIKAQTGVQMGVKMGVQIYFYFQKPNRHEGFRLSLERFRRPNVLIHLKA